MSAIPINLPTYRTYCRDCAYTIDSELDFEKTCPRCKSENLTLTLFDCIRGGVWSSYKDYKKDARCTTK